jgi:aspartyl-tRNA(Asn)/glutamyl-tRNA(Gln) amidotransferase subunit B
VELMTEKKFDYYIKGEKGKWEVIIGLEVHAQVLSKSKLFSSSATKFGAEPNTQVSLVDSAFPGMLPVINQFCIEQSVKTGLGLKAKINLNSVFDRKNYFYADLHKDIKFHNTRILLLVKERFYLICHMERKKLASKDFI